MSEAQPMEKKKWRYTCRLFGMNSLKEGAMWDVDPLLSSNHKISSYTTPLLDSGKVVITWASKQMRTQQRNGFKYLS
jgi:hypothetical protein